MRPTLPPILATAAIVVVGTLAAMRVASQDSSVASKADLSPAVASLSMSSSDPTLESPATPAGMDAGSSEQPDPGILKHVPLPEGPYDAVLAVPADPALLVPPTNRLVNNPVGEQSGIAQSEVSIAVQGDKIAIGWNDGQGFVDGTNVSGYGYSTNRGATWTDGGEVPDGPGGTQVFGDPSVVVTNNGTWVFASLDRGSSSGLTINRSSWPGSTLTWNPALKFNDAGNGSLDKEYLQYDPVLDHIYLTFVNLSTGNGRITRSTDLGLTWSAPVTVNSGGSANGFYPAVGVDGEVYVSWVQPLFQGNGQMYIRHSPDGGLNWSSARVLIHQLGPNSGQAPQCFNRGSNITWPSVAVDCTDGPFRGRVYAAYSDGGANNYDTYLRYSEDKGQTWSSAVKLNDDGTATEQFWPAITVGPDGRVSAGWYDRRNATGNSLCDFYVTQSVDGGITWGPNRRMSDTSVAWCGVPSNIAPNFGDYVETICDDRSVFSVWADGRDGDPDVIFGRIDDVQTLALSAGLAGGDDSQGGFDGTGTAYFIPNEAEIKLTPAPTLESEADLVFVSTVLALLATPDETKGVFQHGGDNLSGHLEFGSGAGNVRGDFSLVRTGNNDIDLQFTVDSDGLGNEFLDTITLDVTAVNGSSAGQVEIFGQARINQLFVPPAVFAVGGTITLGSGATLPANQRFEQSAKFAVGGSLFLHTRTIVTDGVVVAAPDVQLGTNTPPLAVLRSSPNPWVPETRISMELTHESTGSIRIFTAEGRLVRSLAEGTWAAGAHEFPFDGKDASGRDLANGGYFIRLESDRVHAAGKFFVVR